MPINSSQIVINNGNVQAVVQPTIPVVLINAAAFNGGSGGGISGLTAGRIPFATSSTTLGDDNNLNWNNLGKVLITANFIATGTSAFGDKVGLIQTAAQSPLKLGGFATDPSSPTESEISYNTTTHLLKFYDGTSWVAVGSGAVTSVTGTANQITAAPTTGAVILTLPSLVNFPGTWAIGSLGYSDTGILWSAQSAIAGYNQVIVRNTDAGSSSSTNYIVSNNLGTATTFFGEFGMNSSGFTGSGAWNLPNAVYLDSMSADLSFGTLSNSSIHFFTNSSTTDRLTIDGSGNFSFTQGAQSSSWGKGLLFNFGAHTSHTAATEFIDIDLALNRNNQWLAGTVATQRQIYVRGVTYTGVSATATFTNAYTLYVDAPTSGTNATITNNYAAGFFGGKTIFSNTSNVIIDPFGGTLDYSTSIAIRTNSSTTRYSISTTGAQVFSNSPTAGTNTFITFTQSIATNGINTGLVWTGGAHTGQTASEVNDWNINLARTVQFTGSTGFATQRAFLIQAPTYAFVSATGTITNAYTLYVDKAPVAGTNAAITNSYAAYLGGQIIVDGQITIGAPTNAAVTQIIQAGGSGADVSLQMFSKGAGNITIGANGNLNMAGVGTTGTTVGGSAVSSGAPPDNSFKGTGVSGTATQAGRVIIVGGGSAVTGVAGGDVFINGGAAVTGNANGGNIVLNGGAGVGSGTSGTVSLQINLSTVFSISATKASTFVGGNVAFAAGTTTYAPITIPSGTLKTTPATGDVENDGTNYYVSISTTRYTLAKTLTTTATLDFPSTSAGTNSDLTVTVTGAALNDVVIIGVPNGSVIANSCFTAWVSSANIVTIRYNNYDLTTAHDPASGTYRVSVLKYT